jgi:hypothetical protein
MTETRSFPEPKPVDAPPELDRFATAVRRLQDLAGRPISAPPTCTSKITLLPHQP